MQGLLAVAGQRGMHAGTLMIAAGGLALYQMTSLVLGPAGDRQLPLSLAVPTVDADTLSDAARPSVDVVLGLAVALTPSPASTASRPALRHLAHAQAPAAAPPAPIVTSPPALPVVSDAAAKHAKQPPRHHDGD